MSCSPPRPRKDGLTNIEATGEFAINIVSWDLREAMNRSSAALPPTIDEFVETGLAMGSCRNIGAPCVVASSVVIECVLNRVVDLQPRSGLPCRTHVVFGEVVGILIEDSVICDGRVSTSLIRPVSRLGYMDYAVTDETFEMMRPRLDSSCSQNRLVQGKVTPGEEG